MVERARQLVISIRPLRNAFAGEVSGLDITKPIDRAAVAAIEAGMDAYAVLVFHDQDLTDEQQIAFTLGEGDRTAIARVVSRAPGPRGDCSELERVEAGPHSAIMW